MKRNTWSLLLILLSFSAMIVADSCKKYPDPPPVFEKYGKDSSGNKERKVLVISIDGLSGEALEQIAPPNIMKLESNSKYSYGVLPALVSTDASSWATLVTGVGYSKHRIEDSSFVYVPKNGDEDTQIPYFPTIFSYILPSKPQYRMALVTPWGKLANFTRILDYSLAVPNDEVVKDSAVSLLQNLPSMGVMIVDFNEAEIAGNAGQFSPENGAYKDAVLKADAYVGDIMKALEDRASYKDENWLVMITTDHGGSASNPQPGFVVCWNPSFTKQEVKKTGLSAVNFGGANDEAKYATMNPVVNGKRIYDFEKDFTIQFDGLFGAKSGSYPYFFGNKWQLNGSTFPGFSFLIDFNPTWTFNVTSGGKFQVATGSAALGDSKWHTLGLTVRKNDDGSRTATAYLDGEIKGSGKMPSGANLNSAYPLTIGWMPASGGTDNQEIAVHNMKIFDAALDSSDMRKNKCAKTKEGLNRQNNLTGFWACDEATGGVFLNSVNGDVPFILHGSFEWTNMGATVPCSVTPPADTSNQGVSIVPSNADISANILYWLNIKQKSDWNLDGQAWLDHFEKEIYGL